MPALTVENLAKIIGSEGKALLSQMKEAGLSHSDVKDEVTDKDKKTLLEFLKEQQNKSSKTISLNKSAAKTEPASSGTVSITRKTISREIPEQRSLDAKRTSSTINFERLSLQDEKLRLVNLLYRNLHLRKLFKLKKEHLSPLE